MAEFNCDVCGGKVVASAERDGWFECQNCGTEYPLEWMKAKFQSTQTVIVEGGVQVENIASVENLYKRACLLLEGGDFVQADEYFDKVLDLNPEHAPSYMGKLCVESDVRSEEGLGKTMWRIDECRNFQLAMRFGDTVEKQRLIGYSNANKEYLAEAARAAEYVSGRQALAAGIIITNR
jgi:predicted RNA-binding Zn-ribbon protein involved in translation (DUF1610 family)